MISRTDALLPLEAIGRGNDRIRSSNGGKEMFNGLVEPEHDRDSDENGKDMMARLQLLFW